MQTLGNDGADERTSPVNPLDDPKKVAPQVAKLRAELRSVYSQTCHQRSEVEKLLVSLIIWEATVLKPLGTQLPSRDP